MKKYFIVFLIAASAIACTVNKKDKTSGDVVKEDNGMVSYRFVVDGLNDSVTADSIWKIIFQVEGVDKLIISKDDSTTIITVDPALVSNELLRREIEKRGGQILN